MILFEVYGRLYYSAEIIIRLPRNRTIVACFRVGVKKFSINGIFVSEKLKSICNLLTLIGNKFQILLNN